jgi:large subunit ribosomal protein L24
LPAATRPPVAGKLNLTAALEGTGLSPVALIGSLQGAGKLSVEDAELAGLNPRAFDTVTSAVDQGVPVDGGRISDMVRKALDSGHLSIKHGEGALTVTAGQVGVANFTAAAPEADLSLSASVDLIDGLLDAHLTLSGKSSGIRPDIFMAVKGPLAAPERNVDVSALTGWLTLRAVENEAKRLKAIEAAPVHAAPPRPPGAKSDLNPPKTAPPVAKRQPAPEAKREAVRPPLQLTPPQTRAPPTPPIEVNNLPPPVGSATPDVSSGPQR